MAGVEIRGIEELREALRNVQASMRPTMVRAMRRSAILVKGTAKKNCTPGESPYPRAPYSDDDDPRREPPHMRDVMYHRVTVEGNMVRGVVGNPKHYALPVHDGHYTTMRAQSTLTAIAKFGGGRSRGRFVPARPFIVDSIKQHEQDIVDIHNEEIAAELLRHTSGSVWGATPSSMPTAMDEGEGEG
jgi:phage gpG-like protein